MYTVHRPALPPPARCQRVLAALDSVDAPRSSVPVPRLPLPPGRGGGLAVPEGSGMGGRGCGCDLPRGLSPCAAHPTVASGCWMRNALALLLLLLVPGTRPAPQGGGHRYE